MAHFGTALINWLERRWVSPAYAGGLLLALALAFFGAAVNSMAGWLYAISGVMLAIALLSVWSTPRHLTGLQVHRAPIRPTSVGEPLTVELTMENTTGQAKTLLQVRDHVPSAFGNWPERAIAAIGPHQQQSWTYTCHPHRRGVYRWETVTLRTAAPLGLFWSQRSRTVPAHATVYPEIVPLTRCPLIDQMGTSSGLRWQAAHQSKHSNEGLTRAVRPYRWGDPTRLIHWRTSARYGELRVRELEELTADNQILIGLDTSDRWTADAFESAVSAAASLYIYSLQKQISVALWLPHTGVLQNKYTILSTLAEVMPGSASQNHRYPAEAMIWLGPSRQPPQALPQGSAWVKWLDGDVTPPSGTAIQAALSITPQQPLAEQLQTGSTPLTVSG